MRISKFVGLDVHKQTVAVSVADAGGGEVRYLGNFPHTDDSFRKLVKQLGRPSGLAFCYEAGPTGFGLCRLLRSLGCHAAVVAPSLIPRKSGARVKTDRRDSLNLARQLRAGELTAIAIPGPDQEALRDLSRAREDAVYARQKMRQQLQAFLLRHSRRFEGKSSWTRKHWSWLRAQKFDHASQQIAFAEYIHAIEQADARVDRLTEALAAACDESPHRETVNALQSLKGIRLITAAGLVAELGDVTRFDSARGLMSFVGLVPSEHSSGGSVRRGPITKTGNTHARRLLTESAWNYRHPPRQTGTMEARQRGQPESIREIAFKAQSRLHGKYRRMTNAGKKSQVAVTAVARELLGFVWAVAVEVKQRQLQS
jgi:transposase